MFRSTALDRLNVSLRAWMMNRWNSAFSEEPLKANCIKHFLPPKVSRQFEKWILPVGERFLDFGSELNYFLNLPQLLFYDSPGLSTGRKPGRIGFRLMPSGRNVGAAFGRLAEMARRIRRGETSAG